MKKYLFLFTALVLTIECYSYPISPRPLRKLVSESEYIVYGVVKKLGHIKSKEKDYWNCDYAIIETYEIWKGKLQTKTLKVYYTRGMLCPAPPIFIKGLEIIAFLDKRERDRDGYEVHALSYGVKNNLGNEGVATYKARIQEMLALLELPDSRERQEKILEWLVTCTINKYTRWEGAYELSPGSNFMSYYDRDDPTPREIFLSAEQRKRIYNSLMSLESVDYDDVPLVDIVLGTNDSELLDFLKSRLKKIGEDHLFIASMMMERIVRLTSDGDLKIIYEQFDNDIYSYDEMKKKKVRVLFADFKTKMENVKLGKPIKAGTFSDS